MVVRVNFDGIEGLLWSSQDEKEAQTKIKELRAQSEALRKEKDEYLERFGELSPGQRFEKEHDWLEMKQQQDGFEDLTYHDLSEARYCVMSYKKGDKEFECVCSRLGVGLEKPFLY